MNVNMILPGLKEAVITEAKEVNVITIYIFSYQKNLSLCTHAT